MKNDKLREKAEAYQVNDVINDGSFVNFMQYATFIGLVRFFAHLFHHAQNSYWGFMFGMTSQAMKNAGPKQAVVAAMPTKGSKNDAEVQLGEAERALKAALRGDWKASAVANVRSQAVYQAIQYIRKKGGK